jgi:tellurite resistance protein TerC
MVLPYAVFAVVVALVLALDLGWGERSRRVIPVREALQWSALWVLVAVLFGVGIHARMGGVKALEFFTGYVVELSLSIDNVFVFLLLITYFRVPPERQHKVLFWGIVIALVLRIVFIVAGVTLVRHLHAIFYVFGALLIASGIRMVAERDAKVDPETSWMYRFARRTFPFTDDPGDGHFFVRRDGRRLATPLFLVLLMIAPTDLLFAVDSIPAVLAITQDPFIVVTSNVLAVLGLRAMYFALAGVIGRFHYLSTGLAVVLILIGAKMLVADVFVVPTAVALLGVAAILAVAIVASVLWPRVEPGSPAGGGKRRTGGGRRPTGSRRPR